MQGSGGFRLIVRRGPQPNQVYELNKDLISLGRDITNDIVINDPEVSRHHCRLTRTSTGYMLEDLGSTNGTFVNGQRLAAARPLAHNDMVGLGETVTLAYEGAAVQAPTPGAPGPGQQQTLVGSTPPPSPQPGYEQAPPRPYAPPGVQQPYAPPGQQPYYAQQTPPGYEYYEEEPSGPSAGRWLAIGCGCLVVLCLVIAVVALYIIDAQNLWCDVLPFVPGLFGQPCPASGVSLPTLLALLF